MIQDHAAGRVKYIASPAGAAQLLGLDAEHNLVHLHLSQTIRSVSLATQQVSWQGWEGAFNLMSFD